MIHAVIMAGGKGERFWPLSREKTPKQLLRIVGAKTMIETTVSRLSPLIPSSRIWIVTAADQVSAIGTLLPDVSGERIIGEPVGRNTAPCIVLAALAIARVDPSATMIVLPADHVISPAAEFRGTLKACAAAAEKTGRLITIGITPRGPATGYGYIKRGINPVIAGSRPFWRVERFIEKPDLVRARRLVRSPRYTWNSGMFVGTVAAFLSAAEKHLPAVSRGLAPYRDLPAGRLNSFIREVYPRLPAISVDYGLMEKARGVLVTAASFAWDDVGSWDALAAHLPAAPGPGENRCRGAFVGHDAAGCVSFSTGPLVALEGVRDLVVVATGDAVLVCPRGRSQEVKNIVAGLKKAGKKDLL